MRWAGRIGRCLPRVAASLRRRREARSRGRVPFEPTPWNFRFAGSLPDTNEPLEAEYIRTIERLIDAADVFIDVGANVGFFTCLARAKGRSVVALEPFALNIESLARNVTGNGWTDVEIHRAAVADHAGTGTLYGRNTLASRIPGWAVRDDPWTETVRLTTLDDLLENRFAGARFAIKIDVEGAELDVLRGASDTLARRPSPVWAVEISFDEHHPDGMNPHFRDAFDIFFTAGYGATTITREGMLDVSKADVQSWGNAARRAFGTQDYIFRRAQ